MYMKITSRTFSFMHNDYGFANGLSTDFRSPNLSFFQPSVFLCDSCFAGCGLNSLFFSGLCILFLGWVYTWPVSGLLCGSHLYCSFLKSAPTFFACSMGPTLTFSLVFSDTTEERERTREAAVRGSDFFTEVRR